MGTRSRIGLPRIPCCLFEGYRNRGKRNLVSVDEGLEEDRGEDCCNSHLTPPHYSVWEEGRERGSEGEGREGRDRGREDWRCCCGITRYCGDGYRVLSLCPGNWIVCWTGVVGVAWRRGLNERTIVYDGISLGMYCWFPHRPIWGAGRWVWLIFHGVWLIYQDVWLIYQGVCSIGDER